MTATTTFTRPPSLRRLSYDPPSNCGGVAPHGVYPSVREERRGKRSGRSDQKGNAEFSRKRRGEGDALSCCCWWVVVAAVAVAVVVVVVAAAGISERVGREDLHVAERRGRCTPLRPAAASVSFRPRSRTVALGERVTLLHRRRRRRDRCDSYAGLLFIAEPRRVALSAWIARCVDPRAELERSVTPRSRITW